MAFSRPFKEDRLALPLSTSSRWSTVWWPWFCARRWCSQAPQHFRSSETQATFDGCFAHNENVKGSTSSGCFESGCPTMTHANLGFLFHFSLFAASSFNLLGWWNVWSNSHLLRQSNRGNVWLFSPPLSSWRLSPYKLHFSMMVVVPCLTVKSHVTSLWCPSHQCIHYEILRFVVFLNENLYLWICFACWPFSTLPFQVFWQEYLLEAAESGLVPFSLLGLLQLCHRSSLHPFVSFTVRGVGCVDFWQHLSMLWPVPLSVWFALIVGLAWTAWLVSLWLCPVGVPLVFSLTQFVLFCILSSLSRFVCGVVVRPSP